MGALRATADGDWWIGSGVASAAYGAYRSQAAVRAELRADGTAAVFSATTLSAVRVWNAPPRRERTVAMGLWAAAQTVNAVWLGLRPSSLWQQVLAAMSSAGLAAAFAHEARKLDEGAGKMAAPHGAGGSAWLLSRSTVRRISSVPAATVSMLRETASASVLMRAICSADAVEIDPTCASVRLS